MAKIKSAIKKILYAFIHFYFGIRHLWPIWFYVLNRRGRKILRRNRPHLNDVQKQIIAEFKNNGIAITHLDKLFPGENLLASLQKYTFELAQGAEVKTVKTFLKYMFDETPTLDFSNPFLRFILKPSILDIINSYMGLGSRFYYLTLNITTPVKPGSEPQVSQRWHRDPEDKRMGKVFIYLTDVDEGSGPFIYVPGSQYGGRYQKLFPQKPPGGIYPPAGEVERLVAPNDIKNCTGRAGTVIFCDTSGLHKGGYATHKERIMFTGGFQSDAAPRSQRYHYPEGFGEVYQTLNAIQQFALTTTQKKISGYTLDLYNRLKRSFKYENKIRKKH